MNLLSKLLSFFRPMTRYTVLYTCSRGYRCFRTVDAPTEAAAAAKVQEITHNFGELTEVRAFAGN